MPVDVLTSTVIARPRALVSAYATDPANAPLWYVNIKKAEWRTPPPLAVGSRVAFTARFLGRKLEYTYEVIEHAPGERLVMRTSEGPFPMETTYTWEDHAPGTTRMTLRNRGEPGARAASEATGARARPSFATRFAKLAAPLMAGAMRRANEKDLARLKTILEGMVGAALME